MADNTSTTDSVTETDVETADESETTPEAELENDDSSFDDAEDDKEEAESDDTTEDEADESDDKDESEETDTEEASKDDKKVEKTEEPQSDEEKLKAHNREMAEKRIQDKQKRDDNLKKQQDDYLAEADSEDPRDLAVRQLQIDAYNNKVDANTNKLTNSYDRAIKDFDILNDQTPAIQKHLDRALAAFQAEHVTLDKFGNPTEVRGDLYTYLQTEADSIAELTGLRATKQGKDKAKEKSKAIIPPSRAPKQPKGDPLMDGFDEEAARP